MNGHEEVACSQPRILLAEDDDELRRLIAEMLLASGYQVLEAKSGDQLLELLADSVRPDAPLPRFNLVLSDVRMPAFTAMDVLLGARRLLGATPFVLMTAFGDRHLHEQALRLGASAVLDKPIRLDRLRQVIAETLGASPGS